MYNLTKIKNMVRILIFSFIFIKKMFYNSLKINDVREQQYIVIIM